MKLEKIVYDLLFKFVNNANECSIYDAKDKCVLQMRKLNKNALTFGTNDNVSAFNIPNAHLDFPFEGYEIIGRNMITFFKNDGYILAVLNYSDGYELIKELEKLK